MEISTTAVKNVQENTFGQNRIPLQQNKVVLWVTNSEVKL